MRANDEREKKKRIPSTHLRGASAIVLFSFTRAGGVCHLLLFLFLLLLLLVLLSPVFSAFVLLLLLLLLRVPVAFFCPTRSTKKIFPLLPKKRVSHLFRVCGKLIFPRGTFLYLSLSLVVFPSFSSLTRFITPHKKKERDFPKIKI